MSGLPALQLRPLAEIRPSTALRALLDAQSYWPREILHQPFQYLETTTGPLLFLTGPDLVQAAVMAEPAILPRSRLQQRFAGHGTGRENVITDTGRRSQVHRRALAPLFRAQRLAEYYPFIQASIRQAIDPWFAAADDGTVLDATRHAVHATFSVVWQIMFGEAGRPLPPPEVQAMAEGLFLAGASGHLPATSAAIEQAMRGSLALLPDQPLAADTPFRRVPPTDLELTPQESEDNIRFLLTAGHESTALTITWALLMLALHPDIQDSVAAEVRREARDGPLTLDALRRMTGLDRVLSETMRMYPGAIVVNREAACDQVLADLPVAQGTQVAICFYGMHRHRQWWDHPDDFDPGRFDPSQGRLRHPHAFMPFSAGHHSCLGGHLAWMEAMLTLATTVRELRLVLAQDGVKAHARYTLRPDGPVMLSFSRRP